ncbi:secreted RxLR effector protein 161-like [Hevea brasiliensis]|uniref:secreted RxLR effector protein 161-like n=1 Tax=Hevea brasiliensis TaxID=3981 RepID=UPI0025EE83E4|nr:secreted RxLR effector protein 161-like [Hevea brasiliensis]
MNNAKPMTVSFAAYFKLSADMSPKTNEGMKHMSSVPYSSAVGSIMYTMGTTDVGLIFDKTKMSDSAVGYVDSNFAWDLNKKRSLTGYLFSLSGSAINWKATLEATVALSTTEAKYMALAEAVNEVLWSQGWRKVASICNYCWRLRPPYIATTQDEALIEMVMDPQSD